jgi:ABC-type multidrug transport system fused ATPase/permease subunit
VESERVIQANMAAICKNRTVFIIAHRLSTVQGCDRILVMDKGNVIEQGTHDAAATTTRGLCANAPLSNRSDSLAHYARAG